MRRRSEGDEGQIGGNYLNFAGTSSYIDVLDPTLLNFTGDFLIEIEFWKKNTSSLPLIGEVCWSYGYSLFSVSREVQQHSYYGNSCTGGAFGTNYVQASPADVIVVDQLHVLRSYRASEVVRLEVDNTVLATTNFAGTISQKSSVCRINDAAGSMWLKSLKVTNNGVLRLDINATTPADYDQNLGGYYLLKNNAAGFPDARLYTSQIANFYK